VFRYPADGFDRSRIDAGLADGSLAIDTRLRDALAEGTTRFPCRASSTTARTPSSARPSEEVDLVRLDRQIRDLELRIAELEARFWPRVRQRLRRIARRPS
jgi:hypothetical protein